MESMSSIYTLGFCASGLDLGLGLGLGLGLTTLFLIGGAGGDVGRFLGLMTTGTGFLWIGPAVGMTLIGIAGSQGILMGPPPGMGGGEVNCGG